MFCRQLPIEKSRNGTFSQLEVGKRYLLLDAGGKYAFVFYFVINKHCLQKLCFSFFHSGGTVDITVHEVLPDRQLKELFKASGGAWGGTRVDDAFWEFLSKLSGLPCIY